MNARLENLLLGSPAAIAGDFGSRESPDGPSHADEVDFLDMLAEQLELGNRKLRPDSDGRLSLAFTKTRPKSEDPKSMRGPMLVLTTPELMDGKAALAKVLSALRDAPQTQKGLSRVRIFVDSEQARQLLLEGLRRLGASLTHLRILVRSNLGASTMEYSRPGPKLASENPQQNLSLSESLKPGKLTHGAKEIEHPNPSLHAEEAPSRGEKVSPRSEPGALTSDDEDSQALQNRRRFGDNLEKSFAHAKDQGAFRDFVIQKMQTSPQFERNAPAFMNSLPQPITQVALNPEGVALRPQVALLVQRITEMLSKPQVSFNSQIEVEVEMDSLGKLLVDASMGKDGASLHILVENPEAKKWLEENLRNLYQRLLRSGLQLDELNVECKGQESTYEGPDGQEWPGVPNRAAPGLQDRVPSRDLVPASEAKRDFGYNTLEVWV